MTDKMYDRPFQVRVNEWVQQCFGEATLKDIPQRTMRFAEEAIELAQASDMLRVEGFGGDGKVFPVKVWVSIPTDGKPKLPEET